MLEFWGLQQTDSTLPRRGGKGMQGRVCRERGRRRGDAEGGSEERGVLGGTGSRREGCGGGAGRRSEGPGCAPPGKRCLGGGSAPTPRGEALSTVGLRSRQGSTGGLPAPGRFRREGAGNKRGGGAGPWLIYARTSACVFTALNEKKAAAGEEGAPRDLPGGGAAAASTARDRV